MTKNFPQRRQSKVALQINGKTKDIEEMDSNLSEKAAIELGQKNSKISKNISDKKIFKTIFVKNKVINFLVK